MEYILEKKDYDTIKVSSMGCWPGTISYDWLHNYIVGLVGKSALYDLNYDYHTLTISKVHYEDTVSYICKEVLRLDSSLENDTRFMEDIHGIIEWFNGLKDIVRINIENRQKKVSEKAAIMDKQYVTISRINDAVNEYSKTGAITCMNGVDAKLALDLIEEKGHKRSLRNILFPERNEICASTKGIDFVRKTFGISSIVTVLFLLSSLAGMDTPSTTLAIDAIPTSITLLTGAATIIGDNKRVNAALEVITKHLNKEELMTKEDSDKVLKK